MNTFSDVNTDLSGIFSKNVAGMTEKMSGCVIGIAGCGGIGSNASAALARAGVKSFILADFDAVEPSNLNRQYYFVRDIGKKKVFALRDRLLEINPECIIKCHDRKIEANDVTELFGGADILIEAFDKAESKQWLIEEWASAFPERPVISGNGLAGYGDFDRITVRKTGNLYFCGDGVSSEESGLCSARVAYVANLQAGVAIELLMNETGAER